jgi:molecular chaperone GrpE
MLPLVDDFERALSSIQPTPENISLREGVEIIYNKFINFLGQNGVKAIDTENKAFDVEFHEAITTIPAPEESMKGKIIDCTTKGYTLNEKVIRFAKVVVGE